ncbi:MAG: ribonuclease J [Candidatus Caenarcaniphilales bacterium]|jgi:ribonuclease J|nr:ribonuclease J [Candidatus Caenarcaniphilales bacterium]
MQNKKQDNKEIKNSLITLDPKAKVRVISLGGLYEIGKNTWIYECGDDMMLIDAGLAFPTVDMIGVDIVLPKLNYLVENKEKIKALVITHGHEDHIGGVVPLLKEVDIPIIYAPNLALALVKHKITENKMSYSNFKLVQGRETIQVGKSFSITYIRNNHSIADSFSLIIDTPAGRIVHTGDFKFDHSPIDNLFFDIAPLAQAGEDGVSLLISDSTNAEKSSYTPSERAVIPKLKEIITTAKRRVYLTTFASQVLRIKIILELALKAGKRVALFGRSMINLAAISKELGYIKIPDDFIVRQEDVNNVPPENLIVLSTGSQGEEFAALSRIARNEHKYLQVQPGDTVIVSASPIPGNEKSVNNLINMLYKRGADVIYGASMNVHVSGHASAEEQKIMLNLTRPFFFMPCHGEYRMLLKHGQTGVACGVDPDKILIMDNGDVLEMQNGHSRVVERVEAGIIMVDNANVGELDTAIMLERRMVASEGLLTVVVTVNAYGELMCEPKVYSRGLVLSATETKIGFLDKINEITKEAIENSLHNPKHLESKNKAKNKTGATAKLDLEKLQLDVKSEIHRFVDDRMHRHPLLELIIMEYTGKAAAQVIGV